MKNIVKYIAACACIGALAPAGMTSCTDMGGDGIDSVVWNGSINPENTSFHNPVIEPSVEAGTVLKGASSYVAISATTQWAKGLTNYCPTISSNNLMTWTTGNNAFTDDGVPAWSTGRVNSLSVDFARAVTGATYWMFYTIEGENAIGAASGMTAQGPFTDRGSFLTATDVNAQTIKDPFFIVITASYYLCYSTEEGTFIQRVNLNRNNGASRNGDPVKLTNSQLSDIAIVRYNASQFYLFATAEQNGTKEIRYARAENVTGPYLDKSGASLADGSIGEPLVSGSSEFVNPENPMRAFLNSEGTHLYLCYNATEQGKETMTSGYPRRPLFVAPLAIGEDGWIVGTTTAQKGWTAPRFE